jgi:DNA polymerase III delta prime subunit
LTTAAQNALLKITEDAYSHLYFIFSTSNSTKIIEAHGNQLASKLIENLEKTKNITELQNR